MSKHLETPIHIHCRQRKTDLTQGLPHGLSRFLCGSARCLIALALAHLIDQSLVMAAAFYELQRQDADKLEFLGDVIERIEAGEQFRVAGSTTLNGKKNSLATLAIIVLQQTDAHYIDLGHPTVPQGDNGVGAGVPNDTSGSGTNISRDGNTVVGYINSGPSTPQEAFRWTEETGIVQLGAFTPDGPSYAHDVSDDGSVVVGYSYVPGRDQNPGHAFRWTKESGLVDLGSAIGPEGESIARGVSGDGRIVVGSSEFLTPGFPFPIDQPFRWTEADGFQSLLSPDSMGGGRANAVSADGSVVVGDLSGVAFRWTETEGAVSLGTLPGDSNSLATAVSDDGSIVIGISSTDRIDHNCCAGGLTFSNNPTETRAFYWTPQTGIQDLAQLLSDAGLDMTETPLLAATGMTPDGDWIAAITARPDPDFPGEPFFDRAPVLVSLTETLPLRGDYNADGTVDAADYVVWRDNLGSNNTLPNDTSPGLVTEHDYEAWRANFGNTRLGSGLPSHGSNIPEPAAWLLLANGFAVVGSSSRCGQLPCRKRKNLGQNLIASGKSPS